MSSDVSASSAKGSNKPGGPQSPVPPKNEGLLAVGEAWAIGWSAPVLFTLFHRQPSVRDFGRYISAQAKDIDEWPNWYPRSVVHHATASGSLSASQRQAVADMINARRSKLGEICLGYVFCTQSGLTRGVSKVISWLAPPPYPTFHAASVVDGLTSLRAVDPRIEPRILIARYMSLFGEYLPADKGAEV